MAYQGYGRGLGPENVRVLEQMACRGLTPDLTVLLDIDAESGVGRARARNEAEEHSETRMDEQAAEFYRTVREAYLRMAANEPQRFRVIDGRGTVEEVEARIWEVVQPHV
jgi:dTMP kinase